MEWRDKPDRPGWWWYQYGEIFKPTPLFVTDDPHVKDVVGYGDELFVDTECGWEAVEQMDPNFRCRWYGPIPEPPADKRKE